MSKTLEEVGLKPQTTTNALQIYKSDKTYIHFRTDNKTVYIEGAVTMGELKAIYKYCEDNKWI